VYLPFPSLPFCRRLQQKTAGHILSINTSNDAFSAKDVPLGARKMKFNIYLIYSKSLQKYNGAYGETLKIVYFCLEKNY